MKGGLRPGQRATPFRGAKAWLMGTLLWLLSGTSVTAQTGPLENPNRVKAAFLRNFAHYVQWPATAFENAASPWHIGVLGDASFAESLAKTLGGRSEHQRAFAIHVADSPQALPHCQIIVIALGDANKRRAALRELKDKPVLTVGDATEILSEGGIIRFQLSDRVQMSVNLDQARAVSLNIPTQMLEVSTEVLEHGVLRRMH